MCKILTFQVLSFKADHVFTGNLVRLGRCIDGPYLYPSGLVVYQLHKRYRPQITFELNDHGPRASPQQEPHGAVAEIARVFDIERNRVGCAQLIPDILVDDAYLDTQLGQCFIDKIPEHPSELDLRKLEFTFFVLLDLFVLPSHNEGMGRAVVEAMAAGLPVVATCVGGLPDVVVDGETGLLVPPRDPEALAEAMTRLLEDPDLRGRMGLAGQVRAEEFSDQVMFDRLEALYSEILTRPNK